MPVLHARRRFAAALAAVAVGGLLPAGVGSQAIAQEPPPNEPAPITSLPYGLAPPGYGVEQPSCPTGADACVNVVTAEMTRLVEGLGCDHNAAFALLYLRTTEAIRDHIRKGHFLDRQLLNRETTLFARYYLDAFRSWKQGHDSRVPEAWRVAFDAAAAREVHTLGDVFLGINAHVNRDLPFMLYRLGMVRDDEALADHYADHNAVNAVLVAARATSFPSISAKLDDTIFASLYAPLPPALSPLTTLVADWRESAWKQARRLADAPDDAAREAVAADIEKDAAEKAEAIREQTRYAIAPYVAFSSSEARAAYCAARLP